MPESLPSSSPADRSQWLLEALRVRMKFARFAALYTKAGYDPNQPRVPAGNPDGGQWTDTGGSRFGPSSGIRDFDASFTDAINEAGRQEEFDVAILEGLEQYFADLEDDNRTGGHPLDHVGRSKDFAINKLEKSIKEIMRWPGSEHSTG